MGKTRRRRGGTTRTTQEKLAIRKGKRHRFIIISVLTALASLALLIAGFLNFSTPTTLPPANPTVAAPAIPRGLAMPPIARVRPGQIERGTRSRS